MKSKQKKQKDEHTQKNTVFLTNCVQLEYEMRNNTPKKTKQKNETVTNVSAT